MSTGTGEGGSQNGAAAKPSSSPTSSSAYTAFPLAVPRRGHVISTAAESYGGPIRDAIATLAPALDEEGAKRYRDGLLVSGAPTPSPTARSDAELVALDLVASWIVAVATGELPAAANLSEAEKWFRGSSSLIGTLPREAVQIAEASLSAAVDRVAFFQLLPYILDPHGPGSRLSVMRDPTTGEARQRKRAEGVFYTPADVADYMARACMDGGPSTNAPTIFDPACGTGVFLRSALRVLEEQYPTVDAFNLAVEQLFGADIDPWALDATAFVLLADTWRASSRRGLLPLEAWRTLRENLVNVDSLTLDPPDEEDAEGTPYLFDSSQGRTAITRLTKRLKKRPSIILGNPPYANLGPRDDLALLERKLRTVAAKPRGSREVYVAFLEQMVRLSDATASSGALVLPLSIAYSHGQQFHAARELMASTAGTWRFAFFDREPHALFGEDVKTRNAIVLWSRKSQDRHSTVLTGPLRKWRGQSRADMFRNLRFTKIDGGISDGIAKLEGESQASAFHSLRSCVGRLGQATRGIGAVALGDAPQEDAHTVFVGPTAYNFLNVFLQPGADLDGGSGRLSEHRLHAIRCASEDDAFAVFAVLSSHLAYWLWRTVGDGFHVSRRFVVELPFGRAALTPELSSAGARLWRAIRSHPIISVNRGRTTIAFTPNGNDDLRREIDQVLADHVGLKASFVDELQQFTAHTINASPSSQIGGAPEGEEA